MDPGFVLGPLDTCLGPLDARLGGRAGETLDPFRSPLLLQQRRPQWIQGLWFPGQGNPGSLEVSVASTFWAPSVDPGFLGRSAKKPWIH